MVCAGLHCRGAVPAAELAPGSTWGGGGVPGSAGAGVGVGEQATTRVATAPARKKPRAVRVTFAAKATVVGIETGMKLGMSMRAGYHAAPTGTT